MAESTEATCSLLAMACMCSSALDGSDPPSVSSAQASNSAVSSATASSTDSTRSAAISSLDKLKFTGTESEQAWSKLEGAGESA